MNIRGFAKTVLNYSHVRSNITLVVMLLGISISANGQHYKLLDLSEKQVIEEVKNYQSVVRDSSEHEFTTTLVFKNKSNKLQLRVNFFLGKSYQVDYFSPKKSLDSAITAADKLYDRIGDNYWRDKGRKFEVRIFDTKDYVITSYNRGVSDW